MKTKRIACFFLLLVLLLVFSGCAALEEAAKLIEYDFDADKITSVNAVLGEERNVTNVASGIENGFQYKSYSYESETMADDLIAYFAALRDAGWLTVEDYDLTTGEGTAALATSSADEGKILVVRVNFSPEGYTIRMEKGEGTLTPNE